MKANAVALPELFNSIMDSVIDAVIVIGRSGKVLGWNAVAEQTFGWTAEEALHQPLANLIVPGNLRDAHASGVARLQAGGQPHVLNQRLELPALCKDGSRIQVELSITHTNFADEEYFIGYLRDVSTHSNSEDSLRQKLREAELLMEVSQMASEAESFEGALREVLQAICALTGWDAGHAFLVDRNNPEQLIASGIWHEAKPGCAAAMREASDGLVFSIGEGLPGEVLRQDAPVWLSDINIEGNFIRKGFEFRGAFGFPLRHNGRVTAVLEFFSPSPTAPVKSHLLLAQALGDQLGRVIERIDANERREVLLNELNHRNKNLLTIVQSITRLSFAGHNGVEEPLEKLNQRLKAMARAQDLLVHGHWAKSSIMEVIEAGIAGFDSFEDRISRSGPDLLLSPEDVQAAVLVIHELCTNAVKYGAFSFDTGAVDIRWGFEGQEAARVLFFEWRESGCGAAQQPAKQGLGTGLLKRGVFPSSANHTDIEYGGDGLIYRCEVSSPDTKEAAPLPIT